MAKADPEKTIPEHIRLIEEWAEETIADRGGELTIDEIWSDLVDSYICAELGYKHPQAKAVARAAGCELRRNM
jgi:hypothetical protein